MESLVTQNVMHASQCLMISVGAGGGDRGTGGGHVGGTGGQGERGVGT